LTIDETLIASGGQSKFTHLAIALLLVYQRYIPLIVRKPAISATPQKSTSGKHTEDGASVKAALNPKPTRGNLQLCF
jgi:hypothetical protein